MGFNHAGSGKSLCYQLPPLVGTGGRVAVVVSPLQSLMQDQVMALNARGISACCFGTHLSPTQEAENRTRGLAGDFRVLYLTPERASGAMTGYLHELHSRVGLCVLAIDEAHCVSEWGHDFRPAYQQLGELCTAFANVPVRPSGRLLCDKPARFCACAVCAPFAGEPPVGDMVGFGCGTVRPVSRTTRAYDT